MSKFPLNLQFFAEPTDPATPPPVVAPAAPPAPKAASAEDIAAAVLKAVGDRTARAETGVVKSMAEQYGMSEADLKAVLDKHKAEAAKALPEEAQKQIDAAKAEVQQLRLETALVKEGAALGLLDVEVAIKLLPADAIKINDKGEITGLKEALEKLKETKPYLFGGKPGAMAQRVSGSTPPSLSGVEEKFYAKNPGLKKPE